jgi:hypothetical protein
METQQQLKERIIKIQNFIVLLFALNKQHNLSGQCVDYILVLLMIGKLPCKATERIHYPRFRRIALTQTPKSWNVGIDIKQRIYQCAIPVSTVKNTDNDDCLVIILAPLLARILAEQKARQNSDIFHANIIDEAYRFLHRFEPSNITDYLLTDLHSMNHVFIMFLKHRARFNWTIKAYQHQSLNIDELIGHSGHYYESITQREVENDMHECVCAFIEQVFESNTMSQLRDSSFLNDDKKFHNTQINNIRKEHTHAVIETATRPLVAHKKLSASELQSLLEFLNTPLAYTSCVEHFNNISKRCLLVYLLLTSVRPHQPISAFNTFFFEDDLLLVIEKSKQRVIYLHSLLTSLIRSYLEYKHIFCTYKNLPFHHKIIFEYASEEDIYKFTAANLKTLFEEIGIHNQPSNISRHHFNQQLLRHQLHAKARNAVMGHGDDHLRHQSLTSEVKHVLDDILEQYQLEHTIQLLLCDIQRQQTRLK